MKLIVITLTVFCLIFFGCKNDNINANTSYKKIQEKALSLSNTGDSIKQLEALQLYEKAFNKFPDSIDEYSRYDVSLIASKYKKFDLAFRELKYLAGLYEDEEGYPGWSYILDEYAEEDYKNLKQDKRWEVLYSKALIDKKQFFENLKEDEKEFFNIKKSKDLNAFEAEELYHYLKTSNNYLPKKKQNYSISFKINDTVNTSYFIHLPKNYKPENKYSVLVVLHGAVRGTSLSEYETVSNLKYFNRFYTKYADINNVILVFPKADKNFNWMLNDAGFFMVPKIVKQIKTVLNIDNNKVFVSGHSNGATGSFSYLVKQPSPFAGFYGFNTQPKVYTGGTFIQNVLARSFVNFSTDQDYYYPPNANDSLNVLMANIKADYKDYRYNGFPHWFPEFDESEPAHKILFDDILKRKRNPFPKTIEWELDDNANGNIDWISDIKLDTLKQKESWHKTLNFEINKWLKYSKNDSLIAVDVNKKAFDFPRQSGKIIANYDNNKFEIKTSCLKAFTINISPEMIDLKNPVKVYINNKLHFNDTLNFNKSILLKTWENTLDSNQLWINAINFEID